MAPERKANSQNDKEDLSEKPHHNPSGAERLKVVIRRLPPNLPEDVFWNSVKPWVTDETVQWKAFYAGKIRNRPNKDTIPSRAYVAFRSEDQLTSFSQGYDGHVFRDKAGNESYAVVEYAPFQKVPSEKKKQDARIGTIEKDDDYISFLESLNSKKEETESSTLDNLLSSIQAPSMPTTTPLLEALRAEKSAKNDRDAILRNHAHYKDLDAVTKKVEGGKKGTVSNPKSPEQKLSKKAKKAAAAAAAANPSTSNPPPKIMASKPKPSEKPPANAPKAPRAIRQRQTEPSATPTETPEGVTTTPPVPTGNSRRSRPVVGLASRQFEAALTGAVSGGQGERRSKKEDKDKPASPTNEGIASTSALPTSPRKDRNAAKRKEENDINKVPGILPRPQTETEQGPPTTESRGTGRPRRGRGRGRGRGGNPPTPAA